MTTPRPPATPPGVSGPTRPGYPTRVDPRRVEPQALPPEHEGATAAGRRRRPVQVLLSIVLPLLLIAAISGAIFVFLDRDNPSRVIRGYLEAVVAGDVAKAKSFAVHTPGILSTDSLLTAEVLRELRETNRGVTKVYATTRDSADVELAGQRRTLRFDPVREDRTWRVRHVEAYLRETSDAPVKLLGRDVPSGRTIELFPGVYDLASANPRFALATTTLEAFSPADPPIVGTDVTLTPAGADEVKAAARASLNECLSAKVRMPDGCPWSLPQPTNGVLDESTLKYELAGEPTYGDVKLDQRLLGATVPVTFKLHVTAVGIRNDGTKGSYDRTLDITKSAQAYLTQPSLKPAWLS